MAARWPRTTSSGSTKSTTGRSPAWSRTPPAKPRSRPRASARRGRAPRVERFVDQLVRAHVVLAAHAPDGPVVEAAQELHRLLVKRLEVLLLHAVLAADLPGDQLRVVDHLDVVGA